MSTNLRSCVAELIGTFALVYLGAGAVCAAQIPLASEKPGLGLTSIAPPGLAGIALAEGFLLAAVLSATVPVSGGYLNPALTLTLWVFKRLDTGRTAWLIGAQLLGAASAGSLLRWTFSDEVLAVCRLGTPHLRAFPTTYPGILGGIGVEVVLTFVLTFAIFGTMIDPRAPRLGGLGAGLALTAIVTMGFHLTGPAINPARWFGTVIWETTVPGGQTTAFADNLVYLMGPIVGALLAGAVYTLVILPPPAGKSQLFDKGA